MELTLIFSTAQVRPLAPFYDQAAYKHEGPKITSASSLPCYSSTNSELVVLPLSRPLSLLPQRRTWPAQVWSRALNVSVQGAAPTRWPVCFPLCLHYPAFHDHSCPFCGYLCGNFYIYVFTTHLAFVKHLHISGTSCNLTER